MSVANDARQTGRHHVLIHSAGALAIASAVVSAIGVALLIAMFMQFGRGRQQSGMTVGRLNDICVAIQYALTIPIALAMHRILSPHKPGLMRVATPIGVASMTAVVALQSALIFEVLPFEQQVVPVSLAMTVGVGSWLVITGRVARATGRLAHSVAMSLIAVPYLGYPVWAFWLGRNLLEW